MALHIGYETVEPWPLERIDLPDEKSRKGWARAEGQCSRRTRKTVTSGSTARRN